jgi:hypothetical protein
VFADLGELRFAAKGKLLHMRELHRGMHADPVVT